MVIDFDKVELNNKKYLKDDGEYIVTINSYEKGVSSNTATPYLKFECKTDSDEFISLSLYLTDKAFWRFKKFVMALGHPGTGNVDPYEIATQCVGKKLKISCAHKETVDPITNEKKVGEYLEVINFNRC